MKAGGLIFKDPCFQGSTRVYQGLGLRVFRVFTRRIHVDSSQNEGLFSGPFIQGAVLCLGYGKKGLNFGNVIHEQGNNGL